LPGSYRDPGGPTPFAAAGGDVTEIRLAARRDRELFRAELVALLYRLAPVEDDERTAN